MSQVFRQNNIHNNTNNNILFQAVAYTLFFLCNLKLVHMLTQTTTIQTLSTFLVGMWTKYVDLLIVAK